MAKRWFHHLSLDEKAIKFGLTKPQTTAAIYYAPRPSRHASIVDSLNTAIQKRHHRCTPVRPARRHLLSRPESSRRAIHEAVSVELLPAIPLESSVSLMTLFEHSVERFADSLPERLLVRSEVRRVRIAEGTIAVEMTRIAARLEGGSVRRVITLYFGVIAPGGQQLQIARITASEEAALRRQRSAVAAFLRRWVNAKIASPADRVAPVAL